ncbi:MAG: hypothetical protein KAH32_04050 [Chlamydiia bacterium]|nr:hypothetical protein [Chlamydiia bacterium]
MLFFSILCAAINLSMCSSFNEISEISALYVGNAIANYEYNIAIDSYILSKGRDKVFDESSVRIDIPLYGPFACIQWIQEKFLFGWEVSALNGFSNDSTIFWGRNYYEIGGEKFNTPEKSFFFSTKVDKSWNKSLESTLCRGYKIYLKDINIYLGLLKNFGDFSWEMKSLFGIAFDAMANKDDLSKIESALSSNNLYLNEDLNYYNTLHSKEMVNGKKIDDIEINEIAMTIISGCESSRTYGGLGSILSLGRDNIRLSVEMQILFEKFSTKLKVLYIDFEPMKEKEKGKKKEPTVEYHFYKINNSFSLMSFVRASIEIQCADNIFAGVSTKVGYYGQRRALESPQAAEEDKHKEHKLPRIRRIYFSLKTFRVYGLIVLG